MKPLSPEAKAALDAASFRPEFGIARLEAAIASARAVAQHVGPMHAAWDDIGYAEELLRTREGTRERMEELTRQLELLQPRRR